MIELMQSLFQTKGVDPQRDGQGQRHPVGHHPRGHQIHRQSSKQAGGQVGEWGD